MKTILHVFRKEIRDMLRDKRVRSSAFFGPIIVIAMMVGLLGFVTSQVKKKQGQKIHVVKSDSPLVAKLREDKFNVVEVPNVEAGRKLVQDGGARVVLDFHPTSAAGQTAIDAYFDPKEQMSQVTVTLIQRQFAQANKIYLDNLLKSTGLPEGSDEAFKIVEKPVIVGEQGGTSEFLIGFMPYLIVIWAFYGGMSIASDLVAGEKEKNTLETLLISPAARTQIVLGKFLALAAVCLMSSLSSLVGLAVVSMLKLPGTEEIFKNGFGVTPTAFLITLTVLIPLVAFFASLLIALSSYARNPREAQTYLAQFSFIVILPALFSQFIGFTDAARAMWVNFVPILNTANNIRMALMGKPDGLSILLTVATSLVLALAALKLTVTLFNREEVLVRV